MHHPLPWTLLALITLVRPAPADAGEVDRRAAVVAPLDALTPAEIEPAGAPVGAIVDALDVLLLPGSEAGLELRWSLRAIEPGWVDLPLVGSALAFDAATLDGRPVALPADEHGERRMTVWLDGEHQVVVRGTVAAPEARLTLPLLHGARSRVRVGGGDWDVQLAGGLPASEGTFDLLPGAALDVGWQPAAPPAERPVVVTAEAATALRVDAGGIEAVARLRFRIRNGAVDALTFRLPAGVDDLAVGGPAVKEHRHGGDRVHVTLTRPVRGSLALDVSYRVAPGDDDEAHAAPLPVVDGGGWVSLLRGDDTIVVPEPVAALEAAPPSRLPPWARGLIDGEDVASYRVAGRDPALALRLLRHTPLDEPPTLVDEARYEIAYASHGNVLVRARYQVRNDRNPFLRVYLPAGYRLIGATVSGRPAAAVTDDDGALLVPLEKSIETLHGLVTFPVEVLLWGEEQPWPDRGTRALLTPSIDAPVAYARWEVLLPPGVAPRDVDGSATRVEAWTDRAGGLTYGQTYGQTLGDDAGRDLAVSVDREEDTRRSARRGGRGGSSAGAAVRTERRGRPAGGLFLLGGGMAKPAEAPPPPEPADDVEQRRMQEDLSQQAWNEAYALYKDNRFGEAEQMLEFSLELDPDNEAAHALQANVSVLLDDEDSEGEEDAVLERRVREMARARTTSTAIEQDHLRREAESALRAGDLAEAERQLTDLLVVTEQLAQVEQRENVEQKQALATLRSRLDGLRADAKKKAPQGATDAAGAPGKSTGEGSVTMAGQDAREPEIVPVQPTAGEGRIVRGATPSGGAPVGDRRTVIVLEEVSIEGALVYPDDDGDPDRASGLDLDHWAHDVPLERGEFAVVFETEGAGPSAGDEHGGDTGWASIDGSESVVEEEPAPEAFDLDEPRVRPTADASGGRRGPPRPIFRGLPAPPRPRAPAPRPRAGRQEPARGPAAQPAADPAPAVDQPPTTREPAMRIVASPLTLNIPRAGDRLLLEQRLVPENAPLTIELGYRTARSPRRSR